MADDRVRVEFTLEFFEKAEYWAWKSMVAYQEAEDKVNILKESEKDLLAQYMSDMEAASDEEKISEAKLERMARTCDDWKTHRAALAEAIRARGEARVKHLSAVRAWECCQSGLSYKKAELSKLGS